MTTNWQVKVISFDRRLAIEKVYILKPKPIRKMTETDKQELMSMALAIAKIPPKTIKAEAARERNKK